MPIGNALAVIRSKPINVETSELNTLSVFAGDGTISSSNANTSTFIQGTGKTCRITRPNMLCYDRSTNCLYLMNQRNDVSRQETKLTLNAYATQSASYESVSLRELNFFRKNSKACRQYYTVNNNIAGITYCRITGLGNCINPIVNNAEQPTGNGFAIDSNGTAYTRGGYKIYKVESNATFSIYIGSNQSYTDGNSTNARINTIAGSMTFDSNNNLYFVDGSCIRKIDTNQNVTTITGSYNTKGDVDGDSSTSRFNNIISIIFDKNDNLFVLDTKITGTETFRKIKQVDQSGAVTTFKDLSPSLRNLSDPSGMCFDSYGNLYISDYYNGQIWKFFKS